MNRAQKTFPKNQALYRSNLAPSKDNEQVSVPKVIEIDFDKSISFFKQSSLRLEKFSESLMIANLEVKAYEMERNAYFKAIQDKHPVIQRRNSPKLNIQSKISPDKSTNPNKINRDKVSEESQILPPKYDIQKTRKSKTKNQIQQVNTYMDILNKKNNYKKAQQQSFSIDKKDKKRK